MATPEATIDETQASNRLSDRLRNGLALAQTRIQTVETHAKNQWADLPTQLRGVVDRAVARLRNTLDLPSRSDVSELVERLEALDRKISALEKRQGKRGGAAVSDASVSEVSEAVVEPAEIEAAEPAGGPAAVEARSKAREASEAAPEGRAEDSEASPEAGATARKTVKPTSAGKTVKAGGNGGRASEGKGPGKRKKGHGGGRRS